MRSVVQQLKGWALNGIGLEDSYLLKRLELTRKLTIPVVGASIIKYPAYFGADAHPQKIPPEMQACLPGLLKSLEHSVTQLVDEISLVKGAEDAYPFNKAILVSEYVRGWIMLSSRNLRFTDPAHLDPVSLSKGQPWDELQSWTRFPNPMLATDGTPLEPSWVGGVQNPFPAVEPDYRLVWAAHV